MGKVLVIGAGGVGTVVIHKMASLPEVFSEIMLASRTKSKCDAIAEKAGKNRVQTAQVDADKVPQLIKLISSFKPEMVVNVALPYQDLHIMDACLETGVAYLDTANYEPLDEAKFEYSWQWKYQERYRNAGITAILGCGFDPGVTSIFIAYAAKHHFDELHYLDIVDCNAGDHGKPFATNFNPEINIREVTQKGKYWENGKWVYTKPHEIHKPLNYPEIGPKESYIIYHEELESLVPVMFDGREIVPIRFLKTVLPDPGELGENYRGWTSIGCRIRGLRNGKEKTYYIYNNCSHEAAFKETGAQAVSYTTGVPAAIGAMMYLKGIWKKPGVFNVEEFDPDPFMEHLNLLGLPWVELHDVDLEL
jgi:saccharopine dehydrogenase (NAD+, L-lysine-forming)